MKKIILLLLVAWPLTVRAQQAEAPDNDAIEAAVKNIASPYYYPTLLERYARGDSLLGRAEYRHLYYGYLFSPAYEPYASVAQVDSMLMIIQHDATATPDDYRRLIRYGETAMRRDPFNPRMLNLMTYAYGRVGEAENERRSARRFNGVLDAIVSSGEGSEESSPWHILYFSHAEDVMDYLGAPYKQPMVVGWTVEYFQLMRRQGSVRGYYFDYSRVYSKPREVPDAPRRWEFNGTPLN